MTAATLDRVEVMRPGRNYLRRGEPCHIAGERGVFRFVALVTNADTGTQWVDVVGPVSNPRSRSFRPERVRRVSRATPTTRRGKK